MKKVILATTLAVLMAAPAMAQDKGGYGGIQFSQMTISTDGGLPDLDPNALTFLGGYKFNKNFALEGRFGVGLSDDSYTDVSAGFPINIAFDIDNFVGIYAKGIVPLGASAEMYGLIGYTDVKGDTTLSAVGFPNEVFSESKSDTSLGFGFNFAVSNDVAVNLEYVEYLSKDGVDLNSINLGAMIAF